MNKIFLTFLILFFTTFSYSQNQINFSSQNSLIISTGSFKSHHSKSNSYYISSVYSNFELSYSYSRILSNNDNDKLYQYMPTLNLHLFKTKEKYPIQLILGLSYIYEKYDYKYLNKYISDFRNNGIILRGYIKKAFKLEIPRLYLTPIFGLEYYFYEIRGKTYQGDVRFVKDEILSYRGQISFSYKIYNELFIHINPNVLLNKKQPLFGFTAGFGYYFDSFELF